MGRTIAFLGKKGKFQKKKGEVVFALAAPMQGGRFAKASNLKAMCFSTR